MLSRQNLAMAGFSKVLDLGTSELGLLTLSSLLCHTSGHFDLVYALSVFTHFSTPLQSRWMTEMSRRKT